MFYLIRGPDALGFEIVVVKRLHAGVHFDALEHPLGGLPADHNGSYRRLHRYVNAKMTLYDSDGGVVRVDEARYEGDYSILGKL